MRIIAGTLYGTGQSADSLTASDITHAATETDSIRRHHTTLVALVRQCHTVELTIPLVKLESAEIDPGAATHPLVDMEDGALTLVPYRIFRIVDAVVHGLVTHIDGIASRLGEVRLVTCQ